MQVLSVASSQAEMQSCAKLQAKQVKQSDVQTESFDRRTDDRQKTRTIVESASDRERKFASHSARFNVGTRDNKQQAFVRLQSQLFPAHRCTFYFGYPDNLVEQSGQKDTRDRKRESCKLFCRLFRPSERSARPVTD